MKNKQARGCRLGGMITRKRVHIETGYEYAKNKFWYITLVGEYVLKQTFHLTGPIFGITLVRGYVLKFAIVHYETALGRGRVLEDTGDL